MAKRARIRKFLHDLRRQEEFITSFDEHAWNTLVESLRIYGAEDIAVTFRDGSEIRINE